MRMKDSRNAGGDGSGQVSKMSTLDFLVTKMRKHVRSSSADSSPARHVVVEDEVEMRVSEDEGQVDPEDATLPAPHHRPPIYNPEDYAHSLAKYARMSNLYTPDIPKEKKSRGREKEKSVGRVEVPQEMSLKQFSSLAELLRKLREDLKMAYLSFVKEFVRDPNDGVTLLLDVLKMIQLSQTDLNGSANTREQQIALRRALIDEHESLSCLRYCLRSTDSALKLAHYHHGLYTLAVATMSNLARSRTLSLQLLTRACLTSSAGHRQVVEALATLRLRFAEPVKCKFLVAMMLSHPHPSFQVWSLRFINALMSSTTSLREKIYIQEEMAEAGFDAQALRKIIERSGSDHLQQQALAELDRWSSAYIDIAKYENEMSGLRNSNSTLQDELKKLREANMKLLEENVLLKTVGSEVEERYAALQRRLEQNGIPAAPSPAPSVSDSDLSSLNTFRNATMHRNSLSPLRSGGVRTDVMETDSVIFSQGGERSLTPIWNGSPKSSSSHSASSKMSIASDETAISSRPVSASSSSDLTPMNRSRNQSSCSSTPELRMTSPLRSLNASPSRNSDGKESRERDNSSCSRVSSSQEPERKKSPTEEKFNEHMPLTLTDITFRNERLPFPEEINVTEHGRSPPDGMVSPHEPLRFSRHKSRQRQVTEESSTSGIESDAQKSASPGPKESKGSGFSSSASHTPSPRSKSPSNTKRKAPKPPSGTASPFSSSTSSLSSSSSTSSNSGGERKDPEYMNVPFHDSSRSKGLSRSPIDKPRSGSDEGDLDYERDVVVYEAITVANDRIFIDKNNTRGSHGSSKSQSSVETKGSLESRENEDPNGDGPNVRESVRHYENLVMMSDPIEVTKSESKKGSDKTDLLKKEDKIDNKDGRGEQRERDSNKLARRDVSEREVEAVMTGLESVLRSAESSLSLASQETVKENPLLKDTFEDRASPENIVTEELEIVPTRVPHLPSRSRSRNSIVGNGSQIDPVLYLEFESPAETSDTETLLRSNQPLPSPRTIETESTTSFGYVRPEKSLRRHETFMDRSSSERESKEERKRGIKRSESFQMGNKSDYNSHRSYSPKRRGSMDLLVPLEEKEIHISGRTFTKYTPHEVERRNRVNELITAEMNRRKNRSMEDRLDQWFDNHGEEKDWTLKWKYPDISRDREDKQPRQKSSRKQESKSPSHAENNRKSSKSKSNENSSPSKSTDNKNLNPKYTSAETSGPVSKSSRSGKQQKFSTTEIIAFNGFKNPTGFRESDYGPNFMLNKPSSRLPDFSDYGGRDYPPPSRNRTARENWGGNGREKILAGRRKVEIDPDIPTPDYSATPSGTLNNAIKPSPSKHILDMPSGLY
ncbi:serine-rich adhesin for platelets isoform X2 [Palaemon carinicauda]|uniref:serine-rich adhesin for platelets isoform X2 n=1 Tax=Palaemon carinicauda TaxID=392227 RepID=UPI0035B67480